MLLLMSTVVSASTAGALSLVANEVLRSAERTAVSNSAQLEALADRLLEANRVFVLGAGRSGLALRLMAMRFMHLGFEVHVVGETTTPAVRAGDLLIVASGSGGTESIVRGATKASGAGATIATFTTAPTSPLASRSDVLIVVPAAEKLDRTASASKQYAGSLFEQAVVIIGDGLFHALWQRQGGSADVLWARHANLE